jgi:hypothetical protein
MFVYGLDRIFSYFISALPERIQDWITYIPLHHVELFIKNVSIDDFAELKKIVEPAELYF